MEKKTHFKMFKAGKKWCILAITVAALAVSGAWADSAHADDSVAEQSAAQTDQSTASLTIQGQSELTASALDAADTTSNQSATDSTTANIDPNDQGNYAYLENQSLGSDGQLNVSGWHATNGANGRQYHYIIAFNPNNNREIARQNVTDEEVSRPDIQQVHNVYGAGKSGFNTKFDLTGKLASLSSVQIISRYTSDPAGNENAVDYWFAPVAIDRNNYGHLDGVSVRNGQLQVYGWHATNLAADKPYHYVILFDKTEGHEIARQLLSQTYARPDITRAFPGIYRSGQSGFSAGFAAEKLNFHHELQIIDRYSETADGNSQYVDYWFPSFTATNYANQGHLDQYNFTSGSQLTVSGWHANDISQFETSHHLILFDNTANRQVATTNAETVNRPDIVKAFPTFKTGGNSGFNGTFDLTNIHLQSGHTYSIVSRYSTSSQGNGDQGQCTDYWMPLFTLNQHAAAVDSLQMTNEGLHVTGWLASDYAVDHSYAYLLVMNDGREIGRQKLSLISRPDVGKAFPQIYNSSQTGFSTLVRLDPAKATGKLSIILRYSADPAGNLDDDDQYSAEYAPNLGHFDQTTINGSTMTIAGWHASNQSADKPYQYLIFLDQNGHELYRQRITDINISRPDLAKVAGHLLNNGHAGFQATVTIPDAMQHKMVTIIHRLTDDVNGNGNYVDLYSGQVSVNSGAQTSGLKTLYYDAMGNVVGVFNNAEVICQLPELPTGCEMTAVTMMLRYAGVNVSKFDVANATPRSSNGNYGFVGNPYSASGWWVFPTGIAPVVQHYLGTSQVMTGASLQAIKDKLLVGHLVVVWMANMNGFVNHAIALTGYNQDGFFYNNPWTGQKEGMTYADFYGHWNADAQRALSY